MSCPIYNLCVSASANGVLSSVAGGAASRIDPASSAFNPSWRKAISEVAISQPVDGENASVEAIREAQERLREDTKLLDTITTDSAAYYNEVRYAVIAMRSQ